jgi:hypothetical protein
MIIIIIVIDIVIINIYISPPKLRDPDSLPRPLDLNFFKYNASAARSPSFINMREVGQYAGGGSICGRWVNMREVGQHAGGGSTCGRWVNMREVGQPLVGRSTCGR